MTIRDIEAHSARVKHIGILAHSADGAALCFLEWLREGARPFGAHRPPEIRLSILPMRPVLDTCDRCDLTAVNPQLLRTTPDVWSLPTHDSARPRAAVAAARA